MKFIYLLALFPAVCLGQFRPASMGWHDDAKVRMTFDDASVRNWGTYRTQPTNYGAQNSNTFFRTGGSTQHIRIPGLGAVWNDTSTNEWTVTLWSKFSGGSGYPISTDRTFNAIGNANFSSTGGATGFRVLFNGAPPYYYSSSVGGTNLTWNFSAVSVTVPKFVNGTTVAIQFRAIHNQGSTDTSFNAFCSSSSTTGFPDWSIGRAMDAPNPTTYYVGNVDEVRIYNRRLSMEELTLIKEQGRN